MYYNIKYPNVDDRGVNNFYGMNKTTRDGLVSNLYFLLFTRKGERYYNPDFGTDLLKFIFEPNDGITVKDIEKSIKSDVTKYLPEVEINDLSISNTNDEKDEHKITVNIEFEITTGAYSEIGEIEVSF